MQGGFYTNYEKLLFYRLRVYNLSGADLGKAN